MRTDRLGPIVHVVQHLRPGGVEVMALELARAESARHPALVVSLEGSATEAVAAWPQLAGHRPRLVFLGKRPGLDAGLALQLVRRFRALRPACVHTHHIGPLLYAGAAARAAGVPRLLHTEHDAWHLRNRRRRQVARLALAMARPLLVADAAHVAGAFAAALGRPAPRVIPNGVDTERFMPRDRAAARQGFGLARDGVIIGVAARLEVVKGVDIAIRAFAALPPPATLLIAGSGPQEAALRALVAELGIGGRVVFAGHIDEMAPFYRAIDVLCLASRAEGMPLALLEAQACGVPVVAASVGGVPAAVCPQTGHLVASEDVAGFAAALAAALVPGTVSPRAFVLRTASLDAVVDAYLDVSLR